MKFRDLTKDDIECRVQQIKQNGLILLLYKNARVDMAILDETVGPANWQRDHFECKGNLFCKVGIRTERTYPDSPNSIEWIWKSDCGTESNTEAVKGESSDAFKRACFNWGIGRELYTAPFIWIPNTLCKIEASPRKDQYGRDTYTCRDKFSVSKIVIQDKKIIGLEIANESQNLTCFNWGVCHSTAPEKVPKSAYKTQNSSKGSFETDEFFQASLRRTYDK